MEQGNWLVSKKPVLPPPKGWFDLCWERLGKGLKGLFPWLLILFLMWIAFSLGAGRINLASIPSPFSLSCNAPSPPAATIPAIPGERGALVLATVANNATDAAAAVNSLRAAYFNAKLYASAGRFYVYLGAFRTQAAAQTALAKVRARGYPRATIVRQ